MATIHGTCDERFAAVRDVLSANLDSGVDVGASAAVIHEGELVVDIWGGAIDDAGTPWAQDTITNVYSSTKTMCNLSALICAERGLLDLDAPVRTYWPEFVNKDDVLVRHLLSHTAGLPGFTEPLTGEQLYDWDLCCERLAAQDAWWEDRTQSGYHAVTQGYLVGEVVRRVTGKSVGTFFAEEIAGSLGADFHIGTPAECDDRIARLIPPPSIIPPESQSDTVPYRVFANPIVKAEESFTVPWRRAEIPAANGHGNARSIAQIQSMVSHDGVAGGQKFLSPATIDRIFEEQTDGKPDLVFGMAVPMGIGYGLVSPAIPIAPTKRGCFWGGWGGSIVVNDLEHNMTITYVMNKMGEGTMGDARGAGIVYAALGALGQ